MVVDTSILLSIMFQEDHSEWALEKLTEYSGELIMSTVNLTETLIRLRDRRLDSTEEIEQALLASEIRFVAPDVAQAQIAVAARLDYPLNLGDCFAYALAVTTDSAILTLDRDFRATDREVVLP